MKEGFKLSKVTLEDVAKHAGVSRGTVDRVVHERGNVKPALEKRVKEALKELGYEKNVIASALAYKKYSKKLGVIFTEVKSVFFEEKVINGIKDAEKDLYDFGIEIEYASVDRNDPRKLCDEIDSMQNTGINGFAICAPNLRMIREKIDHLAEAGIPVVLFNTDIEDSKRECFVGENLSQSGKIAGNIMSRLIRENENIIIGYEQKGINASHTRVDGFISELQNSSISEDNIFYLNTSLPEEQIRDQLNDIFNDHINIRGIYLASEPNKLCGEFLLGKKYSPRPFVICHDIDPTTVNFLRLDIFDYVIDQDISAQSYRALLILKDILISGKWEMEVTTDTNIYNSVYFQ